MLETFVLPNFWNVSPPSHVYLETNSSDINSKNQKIRPSHICLKSQFRIEIIKHNLKIFQILIFGSDPCRKERKDFGKRTLSEFYVNFASEIFPNRAFPKISNSFPSVPVTRSEAF